MFELMKVSDGPLVGLRVQKEISDDETRELVKLIEHRFRNYGAVRLLVAYEAAPGLMGAESLYENLRFAKLVSDKLAKMAVIGKENTQSTWVSLFGLFGGIQAQYFPPEDADAALAWLQK